MRVPAFFSSIPMPANHSAPRFTMWGRFERVSTLLMTVGRA